MLDVTLDRDEYLALAKKRALKFIYEHNNCHYAIQDLEAKLRQHPELRSHPAHYTCWFLVLHNDQLTTRFVCDFIEYIN